MLKYFRNRGSMVTLEELKTNIDECLQKIEAAAKRASREDKITLVGATKTQPKELIQMMGAGAGV